MNRSAQTFSLWHILLLPLLFFHGQLLADDLSNSDSDIEIYVNVSVPEKHYSLSEIRAIFAMRKTVWSDGSKIHVFVLPDNSPEHRQFTKSRLNMFPHQFRRIWDRLIFSGTGRAPVEVQSFEEMQERLNNTPGSIGYLNKLSHTGHIRKINYE